MTNEEANIFCAENKVKKYFETSSKTGINVELAFNSAMKEAFDTAISFKFPNLSYDEEWESSKSSIRKPTENDHCCGDYDCRIL